MRNIFGNVLTVTLFGESHGKAIGAVLDGLAPGIRVEEEKIRLALSRRRPSDGTSTARREPDEFVLESGVKNGFTTGSPLCILIPNTEFRSSDYEGISSVARPGHCDYPAYCKYHGFEDRSGGGHFSGRVTAALVAAGSIVGEALKEKGIRVATHLSLCGGIRDRDFDFDRPAEESDLLEARTFPVLNEAAGEEMKAGILAAKAEGDSLGGILETAVWGLPAGLGEPWFDSMESLLSHGLFSIPAVKGVEFGAGFGLASLKGSEANDPYRIADGKIVTSANRSGGIAGGLTNGMPVVFRVAVKPTPSIAKLQQTVDFESNTETELSVPGRHDPCIAPRARAAVDAMTLLTIADLLTLRYGSDFLAGEEPR